MSDAQALSGKVVIVTGAGQGIGRGIALAVAKAGGTLGLIDVNGDALQTVQREVEQIGGESEAVTCDVSSRQEVRTMIERIVERFGRLDVIVNNAQRSFPGIPLEEATDEQLRITLESGLWGTFHMMQEAFPYLKRHGGRIINFASSSSTHGRPLHGTYAATKEGIRGMSKVAANEWGIHGITVNILVPNAATPAGEAFAKANPEAAEKALRQRAIPRRGDAERDIGGTVVFLAGESASFITGQTLHVNGGGVTTP